MRTDADERYDRLEALGEARVERGDPDVWDDEYWDGLDVPSACCPIDAGEGVPLGTLGQRQHYRCRSCGIDFSIAPPPPSARKTPRRKDLRRAGTNRKRSAC